MLIILALAALITLIHYAPRIGDEADRRRTAGMSKQQLEDHIKYEEADGRLDTLYHREYKSRYESLTK